MTTGTPDGAAIVAAVADATTRRFGDALRVVAPRLALALGEVDDAAAAFKRELLDAGGVRTDPPARIPTEFRRLVLGAAERLALRRTVQPPLPAPPALADDLVAETLAELVADALGELPPLRRAAVKLHLEGFPVAEIEALLGRDPAATTQLVAAAIADLRAALDRRGVEWEAV